MQTTLVPRIQAAAAIAAQAIKPPAISPPDCAAPGAGRRRCRQAPSSAAAERSDGSDNRAVRGNQAQRALKGVQELFLPCFNAPLFKHRLLRPVF